MVQEVELAEQFGEFAQINILLPVDLLVLALLSRA
jgi:hypothetical protein